MRPELRLAERNKDDALPFGPPPEGAHGHGTPDKRESYKENPGDKRSRFDISYCIYCILLQRHNIVKINLGSQGLDDHCAEAPICIRRAWRCTKNSATTSLLGPRSIAVAVDFILMALIHECSRSAVFLQHLGRRSTSVAAFVQQKCRAFAA